MRGPTTLELLSLTFALGCDTGGGPVLPVAVRTVVGSQRAAYQSASGPAERPVDLSSYQISALVQSAEGQFQELPGAGRSDGSFRIPNVPEGLYLLRVQPGGRPSPPAPVLLITTTEDRVDLGYDLPGRANSTLPSQPATTLALSAGQLSPWMTGDDLQLFIPNLGWGGTFSDGSLLFADQIPRTGDTALSSLAIDFNHANHQLPVPLVDESQGDAAWLAQIVSNDLGGGETYASLSRLWALPPFSMQDGKKTELAGEFIPVPQDWMMHLRWPRTTFAALAGHITGLPPTSQSVSLAVSAHPPGVAVVMPDILRYTPPRAVADLDKQFTAGNKYPADWPLVLRLEQRISVNVYGHNALRPLAMQGALLAQLPLSNPAELTLQPPVGPVTDVRFNDRDVGGQIGVMDSALTVSWRTAEVGTATGFIVDVFDLGADADGTTTASQLLRCYTTQTRVLIPPYTLNSDSEYLFRITAYNMPGVDFSKSPLRRTLPQSSADHLVIWQQY